jgi:hypothetical protein
MGSSDQARLINFGRKSKGELSGVRGEILELQQLGVNVNVCLVFQQEHHRGVPLFNRTC